MAANKGQDGFNKFARLLFVQTIQEHWPQLWVDLREDMLSSSSPPDLKDWASRQGRGIVDDWVIEVFEDTLAMWRQYPNSPRAKLHPGHQWWNMLNPPAMEGYQIFKADIRIEPVPGETLTQIKKRLMKIVQTSWSVYDERQEENFNPDWGLHATWLVLYLQGLTLGGIGRKFPKLARAGKLDSGGTVDKAIRRFANLIGLEIRDKR